MEKIKLKTKIFILVSITVCVSLSVTLLLMRDYTIKRERKKTEEKLIEIAEIVSRDPRLIEAIEKKDRTGTVQNYAKFIQNSTNLDFIVVMDKETIRYSHPVESELNHKFSDPLDAQFALNGESHFSQKKGILGEGLRYLTPIYGENKKIIGVICVGYTNLFLANEISKIQIRLLIGGFLGLLIGIAGSFLLSNQIKKVLLGLEPFEIAAHIQEREIINDGVKEGILAIRLDKKVILLNKSSIDIFNQAHISQLHLKMNEQLDDYVYELLFAQVFEEETILKNHMIIMNQIPLLINVAPIYIQNNIYAAVATIQNRNEVDSLVRELSNSNQYVDALRAQKHNFMNYLHVIKGLIELENFEEVTTYVEVLNNEFHENIGFLSSKIKCSSMVGFLLGKFNEAKENGVILSLDKDSYFPNLDMSPLLHNLLIGIGIMLDNALSAVATTSVKEILLFIYFNEEEKIISIRVQDTGIGISKDIYGKIFERGFSTKGSKRGYGLDTLKSIAEEYEGFIDCFSEPLNGTVFVLELHYDKKEEV